jgi:hypothetical protein
MVIVVLSLDQIYLTSQDFSVEHSQHASLCEATMKFLLVLSGIIIGIFLNTPAKAQNYPWCKIHSEPSGSKNCGFASFQQCKADVSEIGGFCTQNSTYQPFAGPGASRFRQGYPY